MRAHMFNLTDDYDYYANVGHDMFLQCCDDPHKRLEMWQNPYYVATVVPASVAAAAATPPYVAIFVDFGWGVSYFGLWLGGFPK